MSNKCYYSVVRYVPDDLRDEAVNVGVIIETESLREGCLASFATSFSRAASIDPKLERESVEDLIKRFRSRISEQFRDHTLAELVRVYGGGRVQLTQPRYCLTDNVREELAQLRQQFVFESGPQYKLGFTDTRLVSDVRHVLKKEIRSFSENVIRFRTRKSPILFAGKNGQHEFDIEFRSPVKTNLIRCITFDVKGYEDKINAAKVLAFDYEDIVHAGRAQNVGVLSVLYPPQQLANGGQKAFESSARLLQEYHVDTFDFSKESDRSGLALIAKERISEAAA